MGNTRGSVKLLVLFVEVRNKNLISPLELPRLQVENIVAAEYELEHLLLEGHCFDVSSGQPPRGLQFTLGTASEPVIVDTIVMANLVSYRRQFCRLPTPTGGNIPAKWWGCNDIKISQQDNILETSPWYNIYCNI